MKRDALDALRAASADETKFDHLLALQVGWEEGRQLEARRDPVGHEAQAAASSTGPDDSEAQLEAQAAASLEEAAEARRASIAAMIEKVEVAEARRASIAEMIQNPDSWMRNREEIDFKDPTGFRRHDKNWWTTDMLEQYKKQYEGGKLNLAGTIELAHKTLPQKVKTQAEQLYEYCTNTLKLLEDPVLRKECRIFFMGGVVYPEQFFGPCRCHWEPGKAAESRGPKRSRAVQIHADPGLHKEGGLGPPGTSG